MTTELEQIVDGCKRKNPIAQKKLYELYAPKMLGLCMRYTHSRDEAQDLLHDGIIKVFENISRLRKPESVGAWVYQVMVNRCLNHCKQRRPLASLDDNVPTPVALPLDPFADQEIVLALQQLPPQQRLVFNLIEVEDRPYDEVAATLRCSEVNLRALLSRAKARLRDILTETK